MGGLELEMVKGLDTGLDEELIWEGGMGRLEWEIGCRDRLRDRLGDRHYRGISMV